MKKTHSTEAWVKNHVEFTDMGVLVNWIGKDGVDLDDTIKNLLEKQESKIYSEVGRELAKLVGSLDGVAKNMGTTVKSLEKTVKKI